MRQQKSRVGYDQIIHQVEPSFEAQEFDDEDPALLGSEAQMQAELVKLRKMVENRPQEREREEFNESMLNESPPWGSFRWCEINVAIALERADKYGANTILEEDFFQKTCHQASLSEVNSTEYFKEERRSASDGHRGMPRPDPDSRESREFCRSAEGEDRYINMDPAARKEHKRHMRCDECTEHPSRNGRKTHVGCQCCSIWHKDRHSPEMLIKYDERKDHWLQGQRDLDETLRKTATMALVKKVDSRMADRLAAEAAGN